MLASANSIGRYFSVVSFIPSSLYILFAYLLRVEELGPRHQLSTRWWLATLGVEATST